MIRENQRLLNQLHVITDALAVLLAMLAAYWLRFSLFRGDRAMPLSHYVWLGLGAAVLTLIVFAVAGLYTSFRTVRFHVEAGRVAALDLLVALIVMAAMYVLRFEDTSRWTVAFFYAVSTLLLTGKRAVLRTLLRHYRAMGYNQKRVLLVGHGDSAELYLKKVASDRNLGFQVVGCVSDKPCWKSLPYCGGYDRLADAFAQTHPDEVVVALSADESDRMPAIIHACEKDGTKVSVIPFYARYMPSDPQVDSINGLPLINLRRVPLDNLGNAFVKRAMDIVCSLFLIILTSPLMLIAAIGVKLSSPGPVIFKQERVGKDKKPFYMYKFRSMRVNARENTGWSKNEDDRKTWFGSLIRKCSVDELPQFFNVLKGDMSLIGPRPELPYFVEQFKEDIPRYMVKHQVRPGITGWAQVNGLRGDTSIEKRIEYDLYYIENWTLAFDLRILIMTAFCMFNKEKVNGPSPKSREDELAEKK